MGYFNNIQIPSVNFFENKKASHISAIQSRELLNSLKQEQSCESAFHPRLSIDENACCSFAKGVFIDRVYGLKCVLVSIG